MGYRLALDANDVVVREYKEFGYCQGTWIAVLEDGRFVEGSYGSCSGCDAFQGEFGWNDDKIIKQQDGKYYHDNHYWDESEEITEEKANEENSMYDARLKSFGKGYLNSSETKAEIVARYKRKCEEDYAWDDDKEILQWLKAQ